MSNNFALTVCGGAFASMLVVLVCEIQKYFCVKRQTEDDLFRHMGLLWSYAAAMKKNINFCLSNPEQRITYGFLEGSCANIEHESNCSQEIEYYTMIHSKGLYEKQLVFKGFLSRCTVDIQNVHAHVSIAMNQDQIENLQVYGVEKPITASSTRTNVALKESLCKIDSYPAQMEGVSGRTEGFHGRGVPGLQSGTGTGEWTACGTACTGKGVQQAEAEGGTP